jgi:hypothetical protein
VRAARCGVELRWGRDGSALRIGVGQQRFKVGALILPYTPAHVFGRHIVDTTSKSSAMTLLAASRATA